MGRAGLELKNLYGAKWFGSTACGCNSPTCYPFAIRFVVDGENNSARRFLSLGIGMSLHESAIYPIDAQQALGTCTGPAVHLAHSLCFNATLRSISKSYQGMR